MVVSTSGTFRPLVLRPGQSKKVTFKKRACERYTVDGRFPGTVSVGGAPCEPAGTGGGGTPGVSEKIIRYDVTVIAYLHDVETRTCNDPSCVGVTDRELSWTGKWPAQKIKVQTASTGAGFGTVQASARQGTIRGKLVWSETRPGYGGPCSGTIDYVGKAEASLRGSKWKGRKPDVNFDANIVNTNAIDTLTSSKQKAACDDNSSGLPNWEDETDLIVQGVNIHHPPGASIHPMDTRWSREGKVGTTPFPIDRILDHRGFTLNSGTRRSSRSETGYSEKFTGSVKYVFTPVR